MTAIVDKPLPHSDDAERALLGSALLDNAVLSAIIDKIAAVDFFQIHNRKIFAAMSSLHKAGKPIDYVTLMDALGRDLEAAGGPAYLGSLPSGLQGPRANLVLHYVEMIQRDAKLRTLIHDAEAMREAAFASEDPLVIIERLRKRFSEIESTEGTSVFDTYDEFKSAPPLRSLIDHIFHAEVCNIVGGLPGEGKTLILFSITRALLTGKPLFGYFPVLERAPRVVYLIPEASRASFFRRAKLFGLEPFLENQRLLVRTLSKGNIKLSDPRILSAASNSVVHIDTAVRFQTGEENDAASVSAGLATDIFALIRAGALAVGAAHHAPKAFAKDTFIGLENVLRGSGDFGGFVGAGIGIRQLDEPSNIIHVESVKDREGEKFQPFQIIGRPYIDDEGDFRIHRKPGECNCLADYIEIPSRNKGGAPVHEREARAGKLALLRGYLAINPDLTAPEIQKLFAKDGIKVAEGTVRRYKFDLGK
jgi:hypothetical protein